MHTPNAKAWLFEDNNDGGQSEVALVNTVSNNGVGFTYVLKEGYQYPYVGVNFLLDTDSLPNLSSYDYVQLKVKSKQGSRLPIVIGLWEGDNIKPNGNRFMEYILPVDSEGNSVNVAFSQFRSPEWWLKANGKKESDLAAPDFSKLRFLNVQSCQILGTNKEDTIEIEDILLKVDMESYYLFAITFTAILGLIAGLFIFKRKTSTNVVFSYKKTESVNRSEKEEEAVFEFITSHYGQPNLTITDIQNGTGISEAKISSLIKNKSGLTFKQFLNKLRLTESKRLLMESDLQISEIAYKVGYSNVTHFNRIFKEIEMCAPNDFRKQMHAKKES